MRRLISFFIRIMHERNVLGIYYVGTISVEQFERMAKTFELNFLAKNQELKCDGPDINFHSIKLSSKAFNFLINDNKQISIMCSN